MFFLLSYDACLKIPKKISEIYLEVIHCSDLFKLEFAKYIIRYIKESTKVS